MAGLTERVEKSIVAVEGGSSFASGGPCWKPGFVMTVAHTIRREDDIKVTWGANRTLGATLAGRSWRSVARAEPEFMFRWARSARPRTPGARGGAAGSTAIGVDADGPAEQAGVLIGDLVVAINGVPTPSVNEARAQLDILPPGSAATLALIRAGEPLDLIVTVQERPHRR